MLWKNRPSIILINQLKLLVHVCGVFHLYAAQWFICKLIDDIEADMLLGYQREVTDYLEK